jgi:hypothetical protein
MVRLVMGFFLAVFALPIAANSLGAQCLNKHCMVVVDSGSTGTRLHLYAYTMNAAGTPSDITDILTKKMVPGFASVDVKTNAINQYLNDLFEALPHQALPVYFYATGGMRLLPRQEQESHFQALRRWFVQHPSWQLLDARIISGQEEGVFDWLAANYVKGTFALDKTSSDAIGVMDFGGASTQIAFSVGDANNINVNDLVSIDLNHRHWTVFSHSFLGLGHVVLSYQFLNDASCFPLGYTLPTGQKATGDARACEAKISKLVNDVQDVNQVVKSALGQHQVAGWTVLGIPGFLVQNQPFTFSGEQFNNEELLSQADNRVCRQNWADLQTQFPNQPFIDTFCLVPAMLYALMVDGYGIDSSMALNYNTEGPGSDWTLGVVLLPR